MSNQTIVVRREDAALIVRRPMSAIVVHRTGVAGAGNAGSAQQAEIYGAPVLGQVTFELGLAPAAPADVRMFVNGIRFAPPAFTVLGREVTWSNTFTLSPSDDVEFTYST